LAIIVLKLRETLGVEAEPSPERFPIERTRSIDQNSFRSRVEASAARRNRCRNPRAPP
jgi:hypothetical protein